MPLISPSPPSLHCEEKRDEERWECCDASFNVIVIIQVSAEGDAEPEQVSVVQGIPVKTSENAQDVAQDRIDLGEDYEDQIAEESQLTEVFAEERDGAGGHHHHHGDHGAAPQAAPAPASGGYDSPQAPPAPAPVPQAAEQYGAPQAAPIDSYGAPAAPVATQYNPPPQPRPQRPIPVPLPIGVKPGSIVIPGRPQQPYRPPPQKPQYKP